MTHLLDHGRGIRLVGKVVNVVDDAAEGSFGKGRLEVAHAEEVREDDRGEERVLPEESANCNASQNRALGVRDNAHSLVVVFCVRIQYIHDPWLRFYPPFTQV